ncbi:3-deoxy-8-phosphooctulonate synthase [Aquirufa aurantiipilula]|uniref:3-deoxy-8-phosphooctulonate synthase n=1 Tax=Aquirufa aurantiipilula TaxID=2696561 RepID=A0ABT6BLN7_9BACT|nr:3-deoxy-8-phosphooctulonate synthase [Aquirufa aurantiipilula]MBZ1325805.1 3-deoxy-8-phosphooctulonate synthase [Aquirufa aurantiipilula]MDF5691403.1 3-deoxy-8-phosphooctulonate synthase [Aquirufa aurantiipilula]
MSLPYTTSQDKTPFFLMAGSCAIESKDLAYEIAERIKQITDSMGIPFIFKGSYRKANRTKIDSFTGIGDILALEILKEVGAHFQVPTVTDIHESSEAAMAAPYVDVLQIPAFLCRQTDLLAAAAQTGRAVNIKKGQFMSGASMKFAIEKVKHENPEVLVYLTDRGNSFGYGDLVVDFRNLPEMAAFQVPVIMDCTHSLQRPNQGSGVTGGQPALIETIAKAAIAVGADGLFIETHPNPSIAKSDGANMLPLDQLEGLLEKLMKIREAIL